MPTGDNPRSRANLKRGLSTKEARKNGSKGGLASVRARREKRAMREIARVILDGHLTETEKVKVLQEWDKKDAKKFRGLNRETLERFQSRKGLVFARCLNKVLITGSAVDLMRLLEIAGEYPVETGTPLDHSQRTVVQIVSPEKA